MLNVEFNPMRSLLYAKCAKEEYRHKMVHWLYTCHIPESISQFAPYVTKYAFYNALPTPPDGDLFGTNNVQMTEHYWMVNPCMPVTLKKAFVESMPPEVLVWQGVIPEGVPMKMLGEDFDADALRAFGGDMEVPPFAFAYIPVWWENDIKGAGRTMTDGPNYRWQFMMRYPDGVSLEEGDKWFFDEMIPVFKKAGEVTRILTSKIIREVNDCKFHRVVEMWFDGPEEWHTVVTEKTESIKKPDWAKTPVFPYLRPHFEISGIFLMDMAASDNLTQYRGYIAMR